MAGARTNPTGGNVPAAGSLFAVGVLAMLGQVVLLRELAVASFGVELIYLLGLSLWLAAGAAGALLGRRGRPGSPSPAGAAFLLVAALIPLEILFLRGARPLFGGVPGAFLPLGRQVAAAAIGLVPAGAALGYLFLLAARVFIAAGGTLAAAYAWESAGGALGSAAATFALCFGVPNLALGAGCGAAAAAVAASFGATRRRSVAVLAILVPLIAASGPLDRLATSWSHRGVVATVDTPYGRVTIARAGGQVTLFENDAVAFESEGTEAEEIVHLSAPQAPAAPRVLMIGGGAAGVAAEVLKHGPARAVYVESNRAMYRALVPHLPAAARRALGSETVSVVFADPRRFLAEVDASYDLVLVASPEPSSGQSNRFYTREFFRLCASRLSPGGVVALRLPSSDNFWTPRLARRNGSVHAALSGAFADVLVLPGGTDTLLASNAPLSRDPAVLADRLRARGVASRLVTPDYLRYLLTNDRFGGVARLLSESGAPPNSDGTPVCYRETALLWLGKFVPALGRAGPPDRRAGIGLLLAAGAALLLFRRRPAGRRAALAAVAGFGGMVAEGVVLLRYQAESGALYQDIGLLLTAFMAGLAAGAFAFDRAAGPGRIGRPWGAALLGGFALLLAGLGAASAAGGAWFRLGPAAVFLVASGAHVSGIFGYASRAGVSDQGGAAGPVYAADLLGGCIGAILAGLVFIPLFGAGATAAGTAALAAAALVLL